MNEAGCAGRIERICADCRQIYSAYGYRRYKMNRFEEYDLYAANRDFLVSDSIITFTGKNGRLMALKPDVTLSIVRNAAAAPSGLEKLCYSEAVFRTDRASGEFREIMQLGVECLGDIGSYAVSEVISLAQRSLRVISRRSLLDISHTGFVGGLLDETGVGSAARDRLIACIAAKNSAGIASVCRENGVSDAMTARLSATVAVCGPFSEQIGRLERLSVNSATAEAAGELRELYRLLDAAGAAEGISLDLSLTGDMKYYNGMTFRGYVEGIPFTVLSGGRYDRLMSKLGKRGGAVGFAIYLDRLETLPEERSGCDVDVLLLYGRNTDGAEVARRVGDITASGRSVRADTSVPAGLRFGEIIKL